MEKLQLVREGEFAPLPAEMEERYRERLGDCNIHVLRGFGRVIGVKQASACDKEECIQAIADVRFGRKERHVAKAGAHPKMDFTQEFLQFEFRNGFRAALPSGGRKTPVGVAFSDGVKDVYGYVYAGKEGAYLCDSRFQSGADEPIPEEILRRYALRTGDAMSARCGEQFEVKEINGRDVRDLAAGEDFSAVRPDFSDFEAVYPYETVVFSGGKYADSLTGLCPIGRGQRAIAVTDDVSVRTAFFREVARGAEKAFGDDEITGVSLECRSEEAGALGGCFDRYARTEFGSDAEQTVRAAEMAMGLCARCCERGKNAALLIDNLDELYSAYSERYGAGRERDALRAVKRFISGAKATERASLTLIAMCGEELARGLSGGANGVIYLSEEGVSDRSYRLKEDKR